MSRNKEEAQAWGSVRTLLVEAAGTRRSTAARCNGGGMEKEKARGGNLRSEEELVVAERGAKTAKVERCRTIIVILSPHAKLLVIYIPAARCIPFTPFHRWHSRISNKCVLRQSQYSTPVLSVRIESRITIIIHDVGKEHGTSIQVQVEYPGYLISRSF